MKNLKLLGIQVFTYKNEKSLSETFGVVAYNRKTGQLSINEYVL